MKQSLPIARVRATLVALLIVAHICLACAKLPRSSLDAQPKVSNAEAGLRVNLNTASKQELENLPGIGRVIAERIVTHREQYGPFKRPEHLMMVRGISDQKFRAIRSKIIVD